MTEDASVEERAQSIMLRLHDDGYYELSGGTAAHFEAAIRQALLSERRKGREEGLEEAARVMDSPDNNFGQVIRRLKDKQP